MKKFYLFFVVLVASFAQANPFSAPTCTIEKLTAFAGPGTTPNTTLLWNEGSIEWLATPSAVMYEIEINSIGLYGNADIINTYFVPASQTYMVLDLFVHNWFGNNNGKYLSFRVRALCECDNASWGQWSDSHCFLFGNGIVPCGSYNGRVADSPIKTKVGIYPNPVDATINLSDLKPEKGMRYEIVTYQGDVIKSGILDGKTVNVNEIKEGIYLFIIKKDGQTVNSTKFLKN